MLDQGGSVKSRERRELDDLRITRAEALARQIERQIHSEGLPAGTRLGTKGELKTRFGVSVGTVNEAIRVLETRGVIASRPGPGGGLFVTDPSPQVRLSHLILDFRDDADTLANCLAVRNTLEPLIAQDARAFHTTADIAELRAILAQMGAAVDDPRAFLKANWQLHRRMAEISPNAVLRSVYGTLMDYVESALEQVTPDPQFRGRQNLRVHEALVDAIASGDRAKVARAVRRHTPVPAPGLAGGTAG
jgi:DNA-binding FadR family transcriptional regulator